MVGGGGGGGVVVGHDGGGRGSGRGVVHGERGVVVAGGGIDGRPLLVAGAVVGVQRGR